MLGLVRWLVGFQRIFFLRFQFTFRKVKEKTVIDYLFSKTPFHNNYNSQSADYKICTKNYKVPRVQKN